MRSDLIPGRQEIVSGQADAEKLAQMELHYQIGNDIVTVDIKQTADGYRVTIADRAYVVQAGVKRSSEVTFLLDGQRHTAYIAQYGSTQYVAVGGVVFELRQPDPRHSRQQHYQGEDNLAASMPGQVTKVLVKDGDIVQRGQPLVVLEAMKMEIKIVAPRAGRVAKVLVTEGQLVDRAQTLVEISQSG